MRAKRPRSSSGFTLIELLVVVVILGITLGYVGPRLYAGLSSSSLDRAARDILTMVQYARSSAVTKHKPFYVRFDIAHAKFGMYAKPETSGEIELEKEKGLPAGVTFKSVKSPYQNEKLDGQADILVTPEGVVEQGIVYLDGGGGTVHTLVIKPFSGRIKAFDHYVEVFRENG